MSGKQSCCCAGCSRDCSIEAFGCDAALALAAQKVDAAINALFARDLSKRIDEAKKLHDAFMAASLVLDEIAPDVADLPEEIARERRMLRQARENLLHYDAKDVHGRASAWKAARKALHEDCNALLPD